MNDLIYRQSVEQCMTIYIYKTDVRSGGREMADLSIRSVRGAYE